MRPEPEDDIDQLILELNASHPEPLHAGVGSTARLERWLGVLAEKHGSDLLLVAGAPPSLRVDGRIVPLAEGPLRAAEVQVRSSLHPAGAWHSARVVGAAEGGRRPA